MSFIVITGSRYWKNKSLLHYAMQDTRESNITFVHGGAKGADTFAQEVCEEEEYDVITVPAEWDRYGKKAGMIRNKLMLDTYYPELVLAFPMPDSIGTIGCINEAIKRQIDIQIIYDREL